jgi:hypothetical protein
MVRDTRPSPAQNHAPPHVERRDSVGWRTSASNFRGPQLGWCRRASSNRAAKTGGVACGQECGRRKSSSRKSSPLCSARCSHLYPTVRHTPYCAHRSVKLISRCRASRTNWNRSFIACTCLQGIGHLSQGVCPSLAKCQRCTWTISSAISLAVHTRGTRRYRFPRSHDRLSSPNISYFRRV